MTWTYLLDTWKLLSVSLVSLVNLFTTPISELIAGANGVVLGILSPVIKTLTLFIPTDWTLLYLMIAGFGVFIIPYTLISWILNLIS